MFSLIVAWGFLELEPVWERYSNTLLRSILAPGMLLDGRVRFLTAGCALYYELGILVTILLYWGILGYCHDIPKSTHGFNRTKNFNSKKIY